jgi:hypothetical protein
MPSHHKTNPSRVELLEHRRLLSFSVGGDYAVSGYPSSVTVADFNGDGRADFVAATHNPENIGVMLGNANGTFRAAPQLSAWPSSSLDAGDVNGDGKIDLVATAVPYGLGWPPASTPYLQVFAGNGDGTFQSRQFVSIPSPPSGAPSAIYGYYPIAVTIADVDADGKADLVAGCQYEYPDPAWDPDSPYPPQTFYGHYLAVLRGNGNGTFATAFIRADTAASDVEAQDLNGDGKLDLVLTWWGTLNVLLGVGNGTFSAGPSYYWGNAVGDGDAALALADFNGDGKIDLATTRQNVNVAFGDGNGGFAPPVSYPTGPSWGRSLATADFNLDGRPDLVAGNYGTSGGSGWLVDGKVSVLLNDGAGGFRAPRVFACGPSDTYADPIVAAADFNGDGRPDVGVTSYFTRPLPDPSLANVRLLVNDGEWSAVRPQPVGPEFRVTTAAGFQNHPDVASDGDGDFVVVWASNGGGVREPYDVYARRYDSAGNPRGDEFKVNAIDAEYYATPAVAMDAAGNFVVVWRSDYEISARLYDAAGQPRGGEFRVNTFTAGAQEYPSVAMDDDGDFVVAWQSEGQDGSQEGIYARRYDASGAAVGSEFGVNTTTAWSQELPSVAMDADGDFVVAWVSAMQDGTLDVYVRRYEVSGAPKGGEFRVNESIAGEQGYPSVAMDRAGNFAVAWDSLVPDQWSRVYVRRYDAAGVAKSGEFRAGTSVTGHELRPSVALGEHGELTVAWTWTSEFAAAPFRAYTRSFEPSGLAFGEPVQVNSNAGGGQPALASGLGTGFVAAWSYQSSTPQGIDDDVYARVYVGSVLGGDANFDGAVGFDDLVVLAQNYNSIGSWSEGDFNGDGKVDFFDLVILAQNYNKSLVKSAPAGAAGALTASESEIPSRERRSAGRVFNHAVAIRRPASKAKRPANRQ